jgi:SAM-dependent methyltransferase
MHDTAFRIGTLAMNIYADLATASILEIGSHSINGSLRDSALPTTNYVGLDLEEGEGVDIVVEPGIMSVDDDAFDLVIASSVFEHDPAFWMTFLEMCRKTKEGGYIYINAPSNGTVHRFPQDNWRFYPDSGAALVKWAVSQGQHVSLVESFIADREDDIWNDFVAVFRKGRITRKLPETFLYENLRCSNVTTWKSREVVNPRDPPEDMILLHRAIEQAQAAEESLAEATSARDEAAKEAVDLRAQRDALQADLLTTRQSLNELGRVRDDLALRDSELRQREEEIEQTRAELTQARQRRDELAARIAAAEEVRRELDEEKVHRRSAEASADRWKDLHDRQSAQIGDMREAFEQFGKDQERLYADKLAKAQTAVGEQLNAANEKLAAAEAARHQAQSAATAAEAQIGVRFREIATLTSLLRQQEHQSDATLGHVEWLRALTGDLMSQPKWWALMPREWRRAREQARLQRRGLFDCGAYLERYPDVAAAGLDPLYHYLTHGLREGRSRSS